MAATTITFFELSGARAREELATFGARAARRGTRCELLASATEPDLYLLVCRGEPAADDAPPGARTWSFEPLEAFA